MLDLFSALCKPRANTKRGDQECCPSHRVSGLVQCNISRKACANGPRLGIKNADFDRHVITVREAKDNKDWVVTLSLTLAPALRKQLMHARSFWEQDRQALHGAVQTPHPPEQKHPQSAVHGCDSGGFPCHPLAANLFPYLRWNRSTGGIRGHPLAPFTSSAAG